MDYHLEDIETVEAQKIIGSHKSDVQVEIRTLIKLKRPLNELKSGCCLNACI